MQENNTTNKRDVLIQEMLKKTVENNEVKETENQSADTSDLIADPIKNDQKTMSAKKYSLDMTKIKNISLRNIFYSIKLLFCKNDTVSVSRLVTAFVFLPTCLVFFYYSLWASPMYISTTKFSVQNTMPSLSNIDLNSLLFGNGGVSNNDNYLVLEYLNSLVLINEVNSELHFLEHYSNKKYDVFSRLTSVPTDNDIMKYWSFAVNSSLDSESGIIYVDVKAFTPEMAHLIAKVLLKKSEELINKMNLRIQKDSLILAQKELSIAEEKVKTAQLAMRNFRDRHSTFDPILVASGMQSRVETLEAEQTKLQTELKQALALMQKDTPQVKSINVALEAVQKQLEVEKANIASMKECENTVSALAAEYEALALDLKFSQEQQVTAMKALEVARIQQVTQNRYLVSIQEPTFPDESLYPEVFLFTFYTFCGTLLGLGIVTLIVVAVREHAGF